MATLWPRLANGGPDPAKFISQRSARRQPSAVRALYPLLKKPGMISLGGGMPNAALFPFHSMELTLKNGAKLNVNPAQMEAALQYAATPGIPELVAWLREELTREHAPPYNDWDVQVTTGSQDGLSKAIEMLLDPDDSILVENPTYSGTLSILKPMGCYLVGVDTDARGLRADALEETLATWDAKHPGKKFPKALYVIPIGQNPSGATVPLERREAIYAICSKFNIIILEDDPYRYLYFGEEGTQDEVAPRSFFSMDREQRVIRFDTFSKVLGAGLRVGWVTGPRVFIERVMLHMQSTNLHTSSFAQCALVALLQQWGREGWMAHVHEVKKSYRERRDIFVAAARRHLGNRVTFTPPSAGLFVWFRCEGIADTTDLIKKKAVEKLVLMLPGQSFFFDDRPSPYVRAAFSTASPAEMDAALERFASLLASL